MNCGSDISQKCSKVCGARTLYYVLNERALIWSSSFARAARSTMHPMDARPFDSELAHENAAADGITSCGKDGNTDSGAQRDNLASGGFFGKKKNPAVQELKYISP